MKSQRFLRCLVVAAALPAAALADATVHAVSAQGQLDARYHVTLAGVVVGEGSFRVVVTNEHYSAVASGGTTGLLRTFSTGKGATAARGTVSGGQLSTSSYSSTIATERRRDAVRMVFHSGTVKEYLTEPHEDPHPERVPLLEAHRRGVVDPLTGGIIRVPGTGDTFVPQACNRKIPIFDGRMRYDVQLTYKRLEKVKSERGYQGTVVVCGATFVPVAGYVPSRATIKFLIALRSAEMWFAPIAGTRLMVVHRLSLPTPLGQAVLQATQFVTTPRVNGLTPTSMAPK